MIIIGIDPGLQHTGWGIIGSKGNQLHFIGAGTIHTDSKTAMAERLNHINTQLEKILALYKPDEGAVEETFVNKNAQSSLKLGHARGVILLTLSQAGIMPAEYAARTVKQAVVGKGSAEKEQMAMMVKTLLPSSAADSADAADALAVAICHAHYAPHHRLQQQLAMTQS